MDPCIFRYFDCCTIISGNKICKIKTKPDSGYVFIGIKHEALKKYFSLLTDNSHLFIANVIYSARETKQRQGA